MGGCPIRWLVPGLASDVQFNCYSISLIDLPVCIKRVVEMRRRSSRPLLLRQSAVVSAPGYIILKILCIKVYLDLIYMESNSRIVYVCNRPLQYNNRISDEANDRKVAMVTKYMNRLEAVAALSHRDCH